MTDKTDAKMSQAPPNEVVRNKHFVRCENGKERLHQLHSNDHPVVDGEEDRGKRHYTAGPFQSLPVNFCSQSELSGVRYSQTVGQLHPGSKSSLKIPATPVRAAMRFDGMESCCNLAVAESEVQEQILSAAVAPPLRPVHEGSMAQLRDAVALILQEHFREVPA